ncbi:MAG: archaetidylserine decarboxylase [Gemella sp.]|nr:archaetidylserine decarboxylase [Gemella sp.]
MLKKRLFQICVELTNGKLSSKAIQKLTKSSASRLLIPAFIKTYGINTYEPLKEISEFKNLNEFFIREIHPKLRPIAEGEEVIASPTDGLISEIGKIDEDASFVVKGQEYSVKTLLADKNRAKELAGGTYMVVYLSPKNYHRIHIPTSSNKIEEYTLGRHSYPVNKLGLELGDNVLSYNYRRVFKISNDKINYDLVAVGAQNVNSIISTHKTEVLEKGNELGYFEFGSTVVLLFPGNSADFSEVKTPMEIKMGQKIGSIL